MVLNEIMLDKQTVPMLCYTLAIKTIKAIKTL